MGDCDKTLQIDPSELMDALSDHPQNVLLFDVRPHSEYVLEHIKNALSVRLSSILLRRLFKNSAKIESLLSEDNKKKYFEIQEAGPELVVVYDNSSTCLNEDSLTDKNPLHSVFQNLRLNGYKPKFLRGGFGAVKSSYDSCVSTDKPSQDPFALGSLSAALSPKKVTTPSTPIERHVRDKAPSKILDFLYVGAEGHAQDEKLIRDYGITHILNLTTRTPKQHEGIKYHTIAIRDCWNQNLADRFDEAFAFIEDCRKQAGKILIHCVAGISRSPTVAIAYIMKHCKTNLQQAYARVKSKRPCVAPNLDFMGELQQYETNLFQSEGRDGGPTGWDAVHSETPLDIEPALITSP